MYLFLICVLYNLETCMVSLFLLLFQPFKKKQANLVLFIFLLKTSLLLHALFLSWCFVLFDLCIFLRIKGAQKEN